MKFSLSESFRLKSPGAVSAVFANGSTVRYGTLLLHFRIIPALEPDAPPVRMAFAVSKRKFKKSVDRNYTKRLLRECYRIQKLELPAVFQEPVQLHGVISYNHSEKPNFHKLAEDMKSILSKTAKKVQDIHSNHHEHS